MAWTTATSARPRIELRNKMVGEGIGQNVRTRERALCMQSAPDAKYAGQNINVHNVPLQVLNE